MRATANATTTAAVEAVVAPTPVAVETAAAELESARQRWSTAAISDYRLAVSEHRNHWNRGCVWATDVADGTVAQSDVDPTTCPPVEWTVGRLYDEIARSLDILRPSSPDDYSLAVDFDAVGVLVAFERQVASVTDEETSLRVSLTPAG